MNTLFWNKSYKLCYQLAQVIHGAMAWSDQLWGSGGLRSRAHESKIGHKNNPFQWDLSRIIEQILTSKCTLCHDNWDTNVKDQGHLRPNQRPIWQPGGGILPSSSFSSYSISWYGWYTKLHSNSVCLEKPLVLWSITTLWVWAHILKNS